MKYTIPLLLIVLSCEPDKSVELDLRPPEQKAIHELVDKAKDRASNAPNDAARNNIYDSVIPALHKYLKDSARYIMKDFIVDIPSIDAQPFHDIYALTARFVDDPFVYYMEIDYKSKEKMQADTVYKTAMKLEQGLQKKINMAYVGEIKEDPLQTASRGRYEIRVIVMPDSLKVVNH